MSSLEDHERAIEALRGRMLARSGPPANEPPRFRGAIVYDEFAESESVSPSIRAADGPYPSALTQLLRLGRQFPIRMITWRQQPVGRRLIPGRSPICPRSSGGQRRR